MQETLRNARTLLGYWHAQLDIALHGKDLQRIARCGQYIRQCERLITALDGAAKHNAGRVNPCAS